jgi:hypothetical protein
MKFILQIQNSPKCVASTNDVNVPSAVLLELTKADAEMNDYEDMGAPFTSTISTKFEPKIERGENIWIKPLESSSLMMTRT